ncbi:MAG: DNA polymerase III subunit delta [Nitrospiraceae bacterium]|nr:MAG: DNA polymerase III subunit delta [Nitrospiraceae bacterium]
MLNRQLGREIEQQLPGPLYFLWSKESFFLEETLASIQDAVLSPEHRDFNYDVFDSSSLPQEILDTSSSFPLLAQRRLVILKDFHQFKSPQLKVLTPYLQNPSETTCMVILSQKEPKSKIKAAWHAYNLSLHERDIPKWIKQRVSAKGLSISDGAVNLLIESLGTDIGLLVGEIEKLSLSGLKIINDQDILATTGMMREFTAFNLIDAIAGGEKIRAFRILKTLTEKRSSDATAVLGPLNWHYKQFYTLWANKGKRPPRMKTSTLRALSRYLPSLTEEHFRDIFQCLHETDVRIKTSGRPELALEILLIKLLQVGTGI